MKRTPSLEPRLTPSEYYQAVADGMASILAGSVLAPSQISCDLADDPVIREDETSLLVRPDPSWPFSFRLTRSHRLGDGDEEVIKQFLAAFHEKLHAARQPFFPYLLGKCSQDVVARSVAHRLVDQSLIPFIITTLLKWGSQTYEGKPISVAIGVDHLTDFSKISMVHLQDIVNEDFAKVITNGIDTLLVVSPSGHLVEHRVLTSRDPSTMRPHVAVCAPRRYFALAEWADKMRVALVLNSLGEVLVFTKKRLAFAYRGGVWCYFSHDSLIQKIGDATANERLGRAVYDSCLDASFARTGACAAIVKPAHIRKMRRLLSDGDIIKKAMTPKSSTLSHLIGKPFAAIPRPLRQEILALDGAVIIGPAGDVEAAGAIVRVPGGSEGGGRRAAAKALSALGFAIKVSSDGGITAFTDKGTEKDPDVAFEVCT